jgi:hypothetical protein
VWAIGANSATMPRDSKKRLRMPYGTGSRKALLCKAKADFRFRTLDLLPDFGSVAAINPVHFFGEVFLNVQNKDVVYDKFLDQKDNAWVFRDDCLRLTVFRI